MDALSPEKTAEVLDAIESHYGGAARDEFAEAIGSGHCDVVELPGDPKVSGKDAGGKTDATTIGIYFGNANSLNIATVARHELEHWKRASALLDEDDDGEGETTPPPEGGDPETDPGTVTKDEHGVVQDVERPCGPFRHAEMAVEDMKRMRTAANVTYAICVWMCTNWDKWRSKINNEANKAANLGCADAEGYNCVPELPFPACCQ